MNAFRKLKLKYPEVPFSLCDVDNFGEIVVMDTDSIVSKHFLDNTIWEGWMEEYFKKYIKEDTIAIDIGANIGSHTLLMEKVASPSKILAFEPYKMNYDILETNLKINKIENVTAFNFGLSNNSGFLFEANLDYTVETNFAGKGLVYEGLPQNKVAVHPLDDIIEEDDCISFIKCDVEGAELAVLEGAQGVITKHKPAMVIELWDQSFDAFLKSDMYVMTQDLGYRLRKISHMDYLFTVKP